MSEVQRESIVYYEDPECGVILTHADIVNSGRLEKILATPPDRETSYCVYTEIDGEELQAYCTCNMRLEMMKSLINDTNPEYWKECGSLLADVAEKVLLELAPDTKLSLIDYFKPRN